MLTIVPESPHQPDIIALLRESDAYSMARYPAESRHLVDPATLAQSNVHFLVARDLGQVVGCGALVLTGSGMAELKRMMVTAQARGKGVGRRILAMLEDIARREQVSAVRLETGIHNDAALRFYRMSGYHERGPFADYRDDKLSVFMEKALAP